MSLESRGNSGAVPVYPPNSMYGFATLELIEGVRWDMDHIRQTIARYPLPVVLDFVAKVNTVLAKARYDVGTQVYLVERACDTPLRDAIRTKSAVLDGPPAQILFHEAQLMLALRVAVQHCPDRTGATTTSGLADLVRALLALNGIIGPERGNETEVEWFMRSFLPSMVYTHEGWLPHDAARWECLLQLIPARLPRDTDWYDLPGLFRDATGYDLDEARAAAMAYMTAFGQTQRLDIDSHSLHFDESHWLRHYRLTSRDEKLLDLIRADADQLRVEFDRGLPSLFYFVPFYSHPAVRAVGRCWFPSGRLLANKLGTGLLHTVFTYMREGPWRQLEDERLASGASPVEAKHAVDSEAKRFKGFFGDVFHLYVKDLLERCYTQDALARLVDLDSLCSLAACTRCDFVLVENRRAILIECKSRFLTLPSVADGDITAIKQDYRRTVVNAAGQMNATVDAIERGDLSSAGVRPCDVDCYVPVVLTLALRAFVWVI